MDYVQRPVDEAYRVGIEQMGRTEGSPPLGFFDWLDAVARLLSSGLLMRGGVGSPLLRGRPQAQRAMPGADISDDVVTYSIRTPDTLSEVLAPDNALGLMTGAVQRRPR